MPAKTSLAMDIVSILQILKHMSIPNIKYVFIVNILIDYSYTHYRHAREKKVKKIYRNFHFPLHFQFTIYLPAKACFYLNIYDLKKRAQIVGVCTTHENKRPKSLKIFCCQSPIDLFTKMIIITTGID